MDPVAFRTEEELMKFFHRKKTEISCMEEPRTFLRQLRDYKLVDEKLYQKVKNMKSKERKQEGVYEILDRLETERGQCVKLFWTCVFEDHILQKYPVFRILKKSLLDGSFDVNEMLPGTEEPNSKDKEERKVKGKKGGGKRKKSVEETEEEGEEEEEEEEEAGPSSCSTPAHKKPTRRLTFSPPVKKGEKAEIWTWDFYKTFLPVTCGDKEATLYRSKLAQGKKCILYNRKWFSPSDFEKAAGKGSSKNWKLSIRCQNTPLQKLIKENHLQCTHRRRKHGRQSRRVLFPVVSSESSSSETEGSDEEDEEEEENTKEKVNEEGEKEKEDEEEEEEREQVDLSKFKGEVLPVSCGSVTGDLYKKRFAGSRSKSIRTEERWFTPEEFVKQDVTLRDGHWKKDVLCHGERLHYLVENKILFIHSLKCNCDLCRPSDPLAQNNDDVCFTCDADGDDDEDLVCCDECPRAFHKHCHLPILHDINEDKWMCTFCVWKINQQMWLHMSLEDALNSPVTQNIMRCEYLLLCLYKEDTQRMFTKDPFITMQRPPNSIWLNRVKTKLQRNNYSTVREFVNDMRLIFQNDQTLNRDNDLEMTRARLSEIFEQTFHSVFKIQ